MPKAIAQDVARQLKQLGENVFETAKKQPGEMAGKVLEQMGVTTGKPVAGQTKTANTQDLVKQEIGQRAEADKQMSQQKMSQVRDELTNEMKRLRLIREEELRRRREVPELTPEQLAAQQESAPPVVSTKRKRGLFAGFGSRRIKTAQEQFQPETVGRRVGG